MELVLMIGVCALLAAAWWFLRGRAPAGGCGARMERVDRLALTPQHSLHLVRIGRREVLVGVYPGGCALLANGRKAPQPRRMRSGRDAEALR